MADELLIRVSMDLKLVAGRANAPLADAVAQTLGVRLSERSLARFPDGELHVELRDTVRGADVYLLQPTGPPVEEHLFELLLLADACRRAGAERLTAVMPYFGYARHDRRASGREPVAARLVAEMIGAAWIDRVVAIDLHAAALEGFFPMAVEHLTAIPLLREHVRGWAPSASVVVAPDLGAAKLVERFASALQLPTAIMHKQRIGGEEVTVRAIAGDVRGRVPLIVDDMISSGGTIEAAVKALEAAGAAPGSSVVATHGLLVGAAIARLAGCGISRLTVTDSVAVPSTTALSLTIVTLAPLLAQAIDHLHRGRSLAELIHHE